MLKVLKNRFNGQTGPAGLAYDTSTGRLTTDLNFKPDAKVTSMTSTTPPPCSSPKMSAPCFKTKVHLHTLINGP